MMLGLTRTGQARRAMRWLVGCLIISSLNEGASKTFGVMPGLDPGIHDEALLKKTYERQSAWRVIMDCRVKSGNDGGDLLKTMPAAGTVMVAPARLANVRMSISKRCRLPPLTFIVSPARQQSHHVNSFSPPRQADIASGLHGRFGLAKVGDIFAAC